LSKIIWKVNKLFKKTGSYVLNAVRCSGKFASSKIFITRRRRIEEDDKDEDDGEEDDKKGMKKWRMKKGG